MSKINSCKLKLSMGEVEHTLKKKIEARKPNAVKPTPMDREKTLVDFERFIRYEKRFSENNITNSMERARRLVYYFDITHPSVEDAERMEQEMRALKRSPRTIKQYILTLKVLAESMGISLKIKPPRITKTEADFLSIAECRALLNACTNLRDYTIVMILLTTGLRNSECTRIRTSQDVDLKNLQITIRDRGEGMKNYQEKKVLLTKQCAETLKRWVEYRATLKIDNDYLFITTSGEPFAGRERLNKLIKGIAQRAGINRPVTCHMLRHSAAVAMLRAGMPLTSVSRQLGHTSVSTTTEYYLHATYDDLREDIKKYSIF